MRLASSKPAPILAEIPIAEVISSAFSFINIAAATAEPNVPQIDVAWKPRSKNTELPSFLSKPAMPSLHVTSIPKVIASRTSVGFEQSFEPTASAAGTTDALGCNTEGR
ncbi:unannotated protein [freshwater metagenome]|uniref:Unannotated protein n=1 Tax=freshwater metagenome TaxID=449393 RepID=A0A6J6EL79_9ZZZZ